MQGGRQDIGVTEIGRRGPSQELPERSDEIQISPAADALLRRMRYGFLQTISLPMCWLYLYPDRSSFRARKQQHIAEGVSTVLAVQRALRCKFLDAYFQAWSFCAEEEFYLIVLPLLFWNHNMVYARHLTFVVCGGLLAGNLFKDSFQLPRPVAVDKRVWTPKSQAQIDSTACKDFGFPSTHAMNAISNTAFTLLFFYFSDSNRNHSYNSSSGATAPTATGMLPLSGALACTGVYVCTMQLLLRLSLADFLLAPN